VGENKGTDEKTPMDMLQGRQKEIHQQREHKLQAARGKRKEKRNLLRLKIFQALLTFAKFGGNMEMKENGSFSRIPT